MYKRNIQPYTINGNTGIQVMTSIFTHEAEDASWVIRLEFYNDIGISCGYFDVNIQETDWLALGSNTHDRVSALLANHSITEMA